MSKLNNYNKIVLFLEQIIVSLKKSNFMQWKFSN